MGQCEDVFWQLHSVVAGVDGAGATACRSIDWQEVPPLKGLAVADVVLFSLIVIIFYQYACGSSLCVQQEVGSAGFAILTFDGSHQITPIIGIDKSQGLIYHTHIPQKYSARMPMK